ncbi:MAG: methyltransferase domain-containing protein, partial [Coriobacteriales bacterium]
AGTGMFAREFAARMKPGGRLFAVDSSSEMVRWMTQHLVGATDVEIVPTLADAAELPLDTGSADLVYTVNVYHELDDPLAVLKEALRVLRPGARVAIVDWKKEATPKGPPIEHRSDLDAMTGALESAGFTSVTSHPVLRYHNVLTATRP